MLRYLLASLAFSAGAFGQMFAGGAFGVSTLSGDAAKMGSPATSFSQYKPENSPTAEFFAGRHFSDWWSAQATYGWNRNSVLLSAGAPGPPGGAYDFPIQAAMHTIALEVMMYFRPRRDRVRPYLCAGPGLAVLHGRADGTPALSGVIPLPKARFDSTGAALRVAVGMDVRLRGALDLRYTFGETIQGNTISRQLVPQGGRNLANFQNFWGLVWGF